MIRLGTVGTSAICELFLDGAALTGKFQLSAVYSRNKETGEGFARKRGCESVFTDLEAMAKSGLIEAVYIASPNVCHEEQSHIFLENGIHVICEKPIVTNPSAFSECKALADQNELIYMEAIVPRHTAQYRAVKKAVCEIGKIQMARIDYCQRSSRLDRFLSGEHVNIFDMSLHAGALMDIGVYCVYAALDLLGEPKSVRAQCSRLYNGADGAGAVLLDYGDFPAVLTYSKTCSGTLGSEIIGEKGTIQIEKISQYAGVLLLKDGKSEKIADVPSVAVLMSGEAERFADYILDFAHNAEDYKEASELCLRVHSVMKLIKQDAGIVYPEK